MKIASSSSVGSSGASKRLAWISFLDFDFSNIISQTQILDHLAKRGFDVYLFGTQSKKVYQPTNSNVHLFLIPLRTVPIVSSLLYILTLCIFLPFLLVVKKFDYIVLESGTSMISFILKPFFSYPLKLKIILDIRSTPIKFGGAFREYLLSLLFRISVALAKRRFDGITILTKLMKKQVCSEFSIHPNSLGVWTSGVSQDLFNPKRSNGREMRKKFRLDDKFVIFNHGTLAMCRIEGIIGTVKSLKILKSQYGDLVLFLLGEGGGMSSLRKAIREAGLEDDVIVHQKVNHADVRKFIAMCDLGIVPLPDSPNWRYQCPLKLLEYLAMEKVVVATDIPAHREIIGKSRCGIYIPSIDPDQIAKAIAYAYNNRDQLKKWGASGRVIVEREYTWERVAEDFERYLLSL
ncbi:MAG: glycosyltransferase [Candidatus Bathyarchaeota archaeon]|jgi:glycosyltransferase involved in cell wall biosynthesis